MEIRILESDVTRAKIKSACEAFEKLISEDSLSGIMQLTLKQISDDSELTKNPQFDGYKNTLLDVIPQIALELLASPNQQFREKFNQFIREDISLISIYTTWKKIIEETEME